MKTSHIAIIIPTINESENIPILLRGIFQNLPDAYVVIVDDSGEKEHKKLQQKIKKQKMNILLLKRTKKSGRGSAVLYGMKEALKNKQIQYFFEMDADLAHDPKELHIFLGKEKADLVIGSRYLSKSVIMDWPIRRLFLSKLINTFLSLWLDLRLSDYTNGYRLYSRKAVTFLLGQHLYEKGFIALSEVAYVLKKNKFTIKEVPITFTDRKYGKSNADIKELISSLKGALRIRFLH